MLKTSEWVSLGHPDKTADFISSHLLDRFMEFDPKTRYAVEVMIKDNIVTLGGEVTSVAEFSDEQIAKYVRDAVNAIGYTREYRERWGKENTICGDELEVRQLIGRQSPDISRGVSRDAWGDQGIFFGMAVDKPNNNWMPRDYFLAKKLGMELFKSGIGGIDIKTMVAMSNGNVEQVTVAIPLLDEDDKKKVIELATEITECRDVIVNGTGRYVRHSSVADCGVTGRKLAVDLYGGNCRIGGGSPWTKDWTKADLTLNIHARQMALDFMRMTGVKTVHTAISCSIGNCMTPVTFTNSRGEELATCHMEAVPSILAKYYGLDKPCYAKMCREGLFSACDPEA